jgi:charged multivesicular body protein 5
MFIAYFVERIISLIYLSFFPFGIAELDALESDMEFESAAVPSYLQPETDFDADLNLPSAPTRPTAVPAGGQVVYLHNILNLA